MIQVAPVRLLSSRGGGRLVLLALLVLGCARGPSDEELVRGVYREYLHATTQGDLARLRGLVSAPRRAELDRPEAAQLLQLVRQLTPGDVEVKSVTVAGAEATVEAEGSSEGNRATGRVRFVKEAEGWRVDKDQWSVKIVAGGPAGPGPATGSILPDPSRPPRPHAAIEGHVAEVSRLAYTPDGQHLVSASYGDFTLRTWEAESGRPASSTRAEHRITGMTIAPDGRSVYTTDTRGQVSTWPLTSGQLGVPRRLLADAGQALAVSGDGRWLATAGYGKPVRVWSLPDAQLVADLGGPPIQRALAFLAAGPLVTAGDGNTYSVFAKSPGRLWGERWEEGRRTIGGVGPTSQAVSLDVTGDGTLLVTGHTDSSIVVLDLRTRSERFNFFVRDASTRAVRWSPDGALLATAHQDSVVYLWDGRTAKRLGTLREHRGPVGSLAFSPDGGTLASGGEDGRIVLWRASPPGG